ncbi:MAG: glutaredoxin domain-containing protein [Cycloclasticus sp.]
MEAKSEGKKPAAAEELAACINDAKTPIVMFSLEWCEFCWAVAKLFVEYEIPYRIINLDAAEYVDNDRGRNIRLALNKETTWNTLPQIFIGGDFVGGCMDIFTECKNGKLQERLQRLGIPYNQAITTEPTSFLPAWLHPR